MIKNLSSTDSIVRLLMAFLIAILFFTNTISGTTAIVLGVVAIILVATSLVKFCPLYFMFGLSTRKKIA
jgi:hypothetical protein